MSGCRMARVAREVDELDGLCRPSNPQNIFGAPIWPAGVVGSMAHDNRIAVAAVGVRYTE